MTFEELLDLVKNRKAIAILTDEGRSDYQRAADAHAALAGGQNAPSGRRGRGRAQNGASDSLNEDLAADTNTTNSEANDNVN